MENKVKSRFIHLPFGLLFSNMAKQYIGVLGKSLSHLEIERYFYTVVLIESHNGEITQQQLSELLCVDKVCMVRIIDHLTKKKFVKRKQNKNDRREYFLELTEKAIENIPDIKRALKSANDAALMGVTESERAIFYTVIDKMARNLSALPAARVNLNFKRIKE